MLIDPQDLQKFVHHKNCDENSDHHLDPLQADPPGIGKVGHNKGIVFLIHPVKPGQIKCKLQDEQADDHDAISIVQVVRAMRITG